MLWYKAWLETRWRLLMPLSMLLFVFFQEHSKGHLRLDNIQLLVTLPVFWMLAPAVLAGSGIATESPFRAIKGIQGSRAFTLSLPVSRARLLAWRAMAGMTETAATVVIACCVAGLAFPEVRQVGLAGGCQYAFTVVLCCLPVYALSTLFATFLDQQWQIIGTMAVLFACRWTIGNGGLLAIFRAMGTASPLVTHVVPWSAIGFSAGIAALCFLAAAKIVQMREY